jgi:hypothetical protein
MLTSAKARVNGPAFVLGWLAGLGVVGAVVLLVAGSAGGGSSRQPHAWSGWLKLGPTPRTCSWRCFSRSVRSARARPAPTMLPILLDLRDQCLRDLHDLLPAGGGQHELGAAVAAAPDPDMSAVLAIAARKGIEMLDPLTEPG